MLYLWLYFTNKKANPMNKIRSSGLLLRSDITYIKQVLCRSSIFSVFVPLLFSLYKKTESDRVTEFQRQFHRLERFIENVQHSGRAVIIHGRHAASTHTHT